MKSPIVYPLIDTHTHLDDEVFDGACGTRADFAMRAAAAGVQHLLLIGLTAELFDRQVRVRDEMRDLAKVGQAPTAHLSFGLHPLYIREHQDDDLARLDDYLRTYGSVAVSEIGLDSFPKDFSDSDMAKQRQFFRAQIDIAKAYELPIILHIRKSHGEVLQILRQEKYHAHKLGGIAHSFSGGEQEGLAFVAQGFKLGITGQITNPNAKKLRRSVMAVYERYGADAFVIETDCPDMLPISLHSDTPSVNEPANLPLVLAELSKLFAIAADKLAEILWQNSCQALRQSFDFKPLNLNTGR